MFNTSYNNSGSSIQGGDEVKKDVFIRSIDAGILSATIYALAQLVTIKIGLHHIAVWEAAAGMFLPFEQVATPTPLGVFIGLIGHLIIGGVYGIAFYILLLFVGLDRSLYKGFLWGGCIWLIGTLMMRLGATSYMYFDFYEQLGALIGNSIFGLSLGFLVPYMAIQDVSKADSIFTGLLVNMVAQPVYKPKSDKEEE